MTFLTIVLGAVLALSASSGHSHGRDLSASRFTQCPAEVSGTREVVVKFLTSAAHEPSRQETGLAGANPTHIRVLTDAADAYACSSLNAQLGGAGAYGSWHWTYFAVGDRYLVAMRYVDSGGTRRVGLVPLLVYDANLTRLGGYAM